MIAAYRLTDLGEDHRQKTAAMIERAAAALRLQAEQTPDDPSAHNQFAWLVGNTTGDMSEALRHAQRRGRTRPRKRAYLDTLAHVYFYGLNDCPNAVKYQSLAAEYMPYSGLIAGNSSCSARRPPAARRERCRARPVNAWACQQAWLAVSVLVLAFCVLLPAPGPTGRVTAAADRQAVARRLHDEASSASIARAAA